MNEGLVQTLATGLLAFVALPLTGCRDHNKDVDRYRQILDAGAPDAFALRPGEPVTLERAMLLANRHNEQLAIRGEDYIQALAEKDRAFSTFLPTISFAPSYSIRENPNRGGGGGVVVGGNVVSSSSGGGTSHSSNGPLSGQVNVFNGFRDLALLNRAGFSIQQRKALLLDLQSTLLLDVAQAFYEILRAEESVRVLQASLLTQAESIRLVNAQAQKGIVGPLEVSQSLADQSATRVSLSQAQADAANGRSALAFLIGTDAVAGDLIDQFNAPDLAEPIENLQAEAANTRQDLIAARSATDVAYANVQSAIGQYYPSISVDATYLLFNDPSGVSKWSTAIRANVPIFTAGQIEADVRAAWSQYRQSNDTLSLLSRQIRRDVQQAYQNLQTSRQKVSDLRAQVDAAQTAYTLSEERFRRGVTSNIDRLLTLDKLLNAQLQLASENYSEKVFFLDLARAIGRLHPDTAGRLTSTFPYGGPVSKPVPTDPLPTTLPTMNRLPEATAQPATRPTTLPSTQPSNQ